MGYFRTSGFFHLYKSLEKVEKIRILVGINVNKQTHDLLIEAKEQQLALAFSHKETKDAFADEVVREMEESEDNAETEIGVQKFIEFIKMASLRFTRILRRIYTPRFISFVKIKLRVKISVG